MTTRQTIHLSLLAVASLSMMTAGCRKDPPVTMAPPVQAPPPQQQASEGSAGVFNWKDVPVNQEIPISRGTFDQGGYQLYATSGETIVVPFENQNMYVMKFGKTSDGRMYFKNDGTTPTLFVPNGGFLENATAQGAKWYPFSQNFAYSRPVYMGIAPSWNEYVGMGWYPGMTYYGGYWGYRPWYPGFAYTPMIGLNFNIGGRPYYGWNSYSNYYRSNPGNAVRVRNVYNYAGVRRTSPSSFGRSSGRSTFSSGSGTFGRSSGSTGSFGRNSGRTTSTGGSSFGTSGRSTGSGSSGSFGRSTGSGFGNGRSSGSSFGNSSSSGYGGSFGRSTGTGTTSGSSSFGSGRSSGTTSGSSSFGSGRSSGSSSFGSSSGSSGRSSGGSSFGFGRSSGSSSFGSGRSSSFGGSRSFGGRRR
jgi:hypothetical protein